MKKLFSILVALIICLSPVLLLTGCGEADPSKATQFPEAIKSNWEFYVGDTFRDARKIPEGSITYKSEEFDPAENNGKGGMTSTDVTITIKAAIEQGMLGCISGLDTSTVTGTGETRTMLLFFNGDTIEATYTVKEAPTT